uniref:Potassium channel domain-containing protein n=1 Tax=Glossina brevipalpis TaxID=37001 RepID=A0A1A9X4C9_9MUSC
MTQSLDEKIFTLIIIRSSLNKGSGNYFKYSQLTINKLPVSSFQETTEHCLQKQPNNTSISSTQSSLATSLNNSLISSTSSVPAAITQHKLLSISNKKQQHHLQQHLQNTPYNFEVTADNNNIENSVNDTTISTTQTATVYVPIIATGTNMTQPIMKYQTIQVPLCKPYGFTSYVTNRYEEIQLPQPTPTCEIAVGSPHDMRRAKFLTKPFPKEINISLHNNDIICQKDLVQQHKNFSVPSSTSTIMSRTDNIQTPLMGDDDNGLMDSIEFDRSDTNNATKFESVSTAIWAPTSATTTISNSNNICTSFALLLNAGTQNDVTDHTNSISVQNTSPLAYVDQFDDGRLVNALSVGNDCEDETEHHLRQGTPSRIPLIPSASITNDSKPIRASPRMSPTPTHGFNNVKKAFNFQRSSLNAFHDSNGKFTIQQQQLRRKEHHQHIPKPVIINSKGKCNLHAGRRTSISPSFCYAGDADSSYNSDHIDTSDDEEDSKELHALEFLQPDLRRIPHFEFDNGSLESLRSTTGNHKIQHYQVPFIIVILILIFYVCLGTMVFALWENWSLIDGAYFCFVTLTTIGYSGLMPERTLHGPELQLIVCCVYLLLGLVLVAMSLNILETQLIWKCKRLAARLKSAQD